jgi:ABC-2 type transport system ATP-binding protein
LPLAVEINDVSKRFRLYHEKYTSLKERLIHAGRIPYDDLWALQDINLEITQGETVGLLGHNGSGKSTLLKCIAGILQPTKGEIRSVGRLAALLELGAGFHPDLSGRENVYLNASLLGLSRKEVDAKFDAIVGFAELEQFIDNQVKYYSSGMYVRLGFAVAVNMDPDILLIDEVLAVGDELFQRKCIDRIRQFQREGITIIFVTHAADIVRQICDRAAVLDQGQMVALGKPGEAVRSFREHLLMRERHLEAQQLGEPESDAAPEPVEEEGPVVLSIGELHESRRTLKIRITEVRFEHETEAKYITPGDDLIVHIGYETTEPVSDAMIGVAVYNIRGELVFGTNTGMLGIDAPTLTGKGVIDFVISDVPITDGTYPLTIGITNEEETTIYDWWEQRCQFEVMNPGRSVGMLTLPATVDFTTTSDTDGVRTARSDTTS